MNGKKFFLLGFIVVLLIVIPLTVYLAQKQQEVKSHAAPNTTLSFQQTSTSPVVVNNPVTLDLYLDPHSGANLVSFLNLTLKYDPKYLGSPIFTPPGADSLLVPGNSAPVIDQANGLIQETFSVGSGGGSVSSKVKLGTFQFTAIATTSADTPTQITFDGTKAYSANPTDPSSQNVFLAGSSTPASIVIVEAASSTPTPTPTPLPTSVGAGPVCQGLTADRTASGNAPLDISLTATGNDSNATISKITFNFGDGPTQDITQNGGIGTSSISVQVAHTYHNPGSYTASVILTDSNNAVSSVGTCSLPITVFAASSTGGTGGTGTGSGSAETTPSQIAGTTQTPSETPQNTVTLKPTLTTGPNGKIIGAGAIGAILSILGAALFFGL